MRTAILPTLALAFASACAPSPQPGAMPPDVDFDVEPDEVAAGDSITLELDNETSDAISYNLCSSSLEQRSNSEWQELSVNRVCTRELRILASGEETHYRLELPGDLAPGEYRFRTTVQLHDRGASAEIPSEDFRVTR